MIKATVQRGTVQRAYVCYNFLSPLHDTLSVRLNRWADRSEIDSMLNFSETQCASMNRCGHLILHCHGHNETLSLLHTNVSHRLSLKPSELQFSSQHESAFLQYSVMLKRDIRLVRCISFFHVQRLYNRVFCNNMLRHHKWISKITLYINCLWGYVGIYKATLPMTLGQSNSNNSKSSLRLSNTLFAFSSVTVTPSKET